MLKADEAKEKADRAAGRMAAQSPDGERIYKDQQAIKGEKKDIVADAAKMKADQRK